jgi:CheY-like chemotaxis protein
MTRTSESRDTRPKVLYVDTAGGSELKPMRPVLDPHYRITTLDDHRQAVNLVAAEPFQVVITNAKPRGMTLDEFIRRIRVERPGVKVIVYTSHTSDKDPLDCGADAVLQKPVIAPQALGWVIDRALTDFAPGIFVIPARSVS